jgi:hypothetical protein
MTHSYKTLNFDWLELNRFILAKFIGVYSLISPVTTDAKGGRHLSVQRRSLLTRMGSGALSDDMDMLMAGHQVVYLIINEYSMLVKSFLALLSKHISIGKEGSESGSSGSFGGINVILCGDLHQFPPVVAAPSEALYQPVTVWDTD